MMNKEEIIKRIIANRKNIDFINGECDPEEWIKRELRGNRRTIKKIRDYIEDPSPPVTITKYRLFENAKTLAAVNPCDLGDLYWPFRDEFTQENYVQTKKEMAKHHVNGSRHFIHFSSSDLTKNLVPFKKVGNKFDLWELDPHDWPLMKWRIEQDIIRGIVPILCVACGWKGVDDQYKKTAWHPSHNIGVKVGGKTIYMTPDHGELYRDSDSGKIFRGVAEMLVDALDTDKFILEASNEPPKNIGEITLFRFYNALFKQLVKNKQLDPSRMAFEKFDSRWIGIKKINPDVEPGLMDLYPGVWMFYHAQNTIEQAMRWHRGHMGSIHNAYPGPCACSDGGSTSYPGQGLIGKKWGGGGKNIRYRRITPMELYQFLRYDYRHNGGGYCHLSATCRFESDDWNYESFDKAGVRGFTEQELEEWVEQVRKWRNLPSFDADWQDFSDDNDEPLSELMAVKHAMDHIHK